MTEANKDEMFFRTLAIAVLLATVLLTIVSITDYVIKLGVLS